MKIFISQPMRDLTEEQIDSERNAIEEWAHSEYSDCNILPRFTSLQLADKDPVECLGLSIQMMAKADLVIFAPDWHIARGCVIEHAVCSAYGCEIVELHRGQDNSLKVYSAG